MVVKFTTLILLGSTIAGWCQSDDEIIRIAESTAIGTPSRCDSHLAVGRYYVGKRDYTAAIGRLKVAVQKCPTSSDTPEILAHLAEAFLAHGVASQAQIAVAVLERKFPGARFTVEARNALSSAGHNPVEDENSWIALAFQ